MIVYAQVYDFYFVWDDKTEPVGHLHHPFLLNPSWDSFYQLLVQPYYGMYVPMTYFLWGLLKAFSEFSTLPLNSIFHLSNVLVHIINGLLVFSILKQFIANKWSVLVGVLFFLLHPIQVEAVAWISEFRGLMAFCFSLTALYIYLKNQTTFSFLPLFLFVFALLSKPSAVVLVLFVFAINYFYYKVKLGENIKKTLPFVIIAIVFVIIAHQVQFQYDTDISAHSIAIWQRPFAWIDSLVFYLLKIIFPFNLGASYALSPKFISSQWWFYPLAFLPLSLGYFVWLKRKTQPMLIFAIVLLLAGFFTTSGLLNFGFQKYSLVADRYLYFSMVGVALFTAFAFNTNKKIKQSLIIVILLVFASLSVFRQVPVWKNAFTLWDHSKDFEVKPRYAHLNLAVFLNNQGLKMGHSKKYQQAVNYFTQAIKYYPGYALAKASNSFYNRSVILLRQKKYRKALTDLNQVLRMQPKNKSANDAKVHILTLLKQCKEAREAVNFARKNQVKLQDGVLANIEKTCFNTEKIKR